MLRYPNGFLFFWVVLGENPRGFKKKGWMLGPKQRKQMMKEFSWAVGWEISTIWNFIPGNYISGKTRWPPIRVRAFRHQNDKGSQIRQLCLNYSLMQLVIWMAKTPEICFFLNNNKRFPKKMAFIIDAAWVIHWVSFLRDYRWPF